jgi:hypothetical protein
MIVVFLAISLSENAVPCFFSSGMSVATNTDGVMKDYSVLSTYVPCFVTVFDEIIKIFQAKKG